MSLNCDICAKTFTTNSVLYRHKRQIHKIVSKHYQQHDFNVHNNKCFTCYTSFKYIKHLRDHLVQQHNFVSDVEELSFRNLSEFENWLETICKRDKVQYVLMRGTKHVDLEIGRGRVSFYSCSRSVKKTQRKPSSPQRKRTTKTRKLDYACTSQIKLTEVGGYCFATYFKTHYRHERDVKHLRILKSEREAIARKLLVGVPTSEFVFGANFKFQIYSQLSFVCRVLEEVKEENTDEKDVQRINLLTRKDINNIKRSSFFVDASKQSEGDLKMKILDTIQGISDKVKNTEMQNNVLLDVCELVQAAAGILNHEINNVESNRIETYLLKVEPSDY